MAAAQQKGVGLGIASFGHCEVVESYLTHMLASTAHANAFSSDTNIITPRAAGGRDGAILRAGKPHMLWLLMERHSPPVTDPRSVLFFDDDEANIVECHRQGFHRSVHVPSAFTRLAVSRGPAPLAHPAPTLPKASRRG